jgi:cysteine synthase
MSFKPQIIEITDPCLQLENGNRVFSTLEGENPGGSMKDHMVRGEIEDLLKRNLIRSGGGISEVSAGSTATSLAHYCSEYGLKCVLFVPNGIAENIVVGLKEKGAEIHSEEMGVIYHNYDKFLAANSGLIRFNQLFDTHKRRHYHSLGFAIRREIGAVSAIIGGVGTGHSLLGTAEGLNCAWVVTAEPESVFKVPGVRNIAVDRYGAEDFLGRQNFNQRILVGEQEILDKGSIITSAGLVQAGRSFNLVLTALRAYLQDKSNQRIFAMGAALKRVDAEVLRIAS